MVWSDPLSLATTHGVSLPAGTEMFHFPAYPRNKRSVPAHDGRRVAPFGNPRIEAMLEAPRGLSHPQTSFIGTVCQGIHHTPFRAAHAPKNPNDSFKRQTTNHHTVKNDHKTIDLETRLQKRAWRNRDKANDGHRSPSHCSRPLSSSQTTTHPDRTRPAAHKADGVPPGASGKPHATKRRGWRSGNPKAYPYHSPDPQGNPRAHDLFHTSTPTREPGNIPDAWATRRTPDRRPEKLRRKEVIQPHLPVRLPCYDLVPITSLTLDGSIQKG